MKRISRVMREDLADAHGIFDYICHVVLQNRLGIEPECQKMTPDNSFNVIIMCKLVRKICNGSTDLMWNAVEAMHSLLSLRGDSCQSLPKHLEDHSQRHQ